MNKIVAFIFPEKANADEANLAFKKFCAERIEVYALTIISKDSDSRLSVLEHTYDGSHVTAVAAMLGGWLVCLVVSWLRYSAPSGAH